MRSQIRRAAALCSASIAAIALVTSPAFAASDVQCGPGGIDCSGGTGFVGANGDLPGDGSTGGGDSGGGVLDPVSTGPQPVVVVHHCGSRITVLVARGVTNGECTVAHLRCPLEPGQTRDLTVESTETVTTMPDGTVTTTIMCDVPVAGAAPQVTAADVRQWVVRQLPIGSIGTPAARSLINAKTVLWLEVPSVREWGPVTVVQAGVRIRATLVSVDWDFGDGTTDSSSTAGRPYDKADPCDARCEDYYGHAYSRAGAVTVRAQAYWRAEFSVNGAGFTALPAPVPAIAAPAVQITQLQARSQLIDGG